MSQRAVIVIEGNSRRFRDEEAEAEMSTVAEDDRTDDGTRDHKHHAKLAGRKIA